MPDPGDRRSGRPDRAPAREPALTGSDPDLLGRVAALIDDLATGLDRPPLIGIAGSQGSGKSTLARAVAVRRGAAQLSMDDVYLTQAERAAMATRVHPLFQTRGPPGTHDLGLLNRVIDALSAATDVSITALPAFDKLADERASPDHWPVFAGRPPAIVIEGWCLGATAQTAEALARPINTLERERDPQGVWRRAVNDRLAGDYAALTRRFDAVVFLAAPGFDIVLDWRCQQEAGLLGVAPADLPPADRARLAGFIQYFERITRHMLAGGVRADLTVRLDADRRPV